MRTQREGRWLLALTGVGLLAYVVAEVAALIWVSGQIGWWTLVVLVSTSVLGIYLLGREWKKTWARLSQSLRAGQLPSGQLADASLVIAGGILLLLPGLLSDIAGALLLLPFTRPFVRSGISWWANKTLQRSGATPTVIKGETVDTSSDTLIPGLSTGNDDGVVEGTIIEPDK